MWNTTVELWLDKWLVNNHHSGLFQAYGLSGKIHSNFLWKYVQELQGPYLKWFTFFASEKLATYLNW